MADLDSYASFVRMQIDKLKLTFPELEDDAELLSGMVEGETNFEHVIDLVINAYLDAKTLETAALIRLSDLKERAARMERKADAMRLLAFGLMEAAGQTTIRRPEATLAISRGKERLEIDDDFNAQGYMRVKAEPMKDDIRAALAAGDQIPGARMLPGRPFLTVRPK